MIFVRRSRRCGDIRFVASGGKVTSQLRFSPFFCNWRFPKIGGFYPQNGWFISWKTLLKLMIWGYHYSWKHPTVASLLSFFFSMTFFLKRKQLWKLCDEELRFAWLGRMTHSDSKRWSPNRPHLQIPQHDLSRMTCVLTEHLAGSSHVIWSEVDIERRNSEPFRRQGPPTSLVWKWIMINIRRCTCWLVLWVGGFQWMV